MKVALLKALQSTVLKAVNGVKYQVAVQKGDSKIIKREPEIHLQRLPDSKSANKIVPYIIIQFLHEKHMRVLPPKPQRTAEIRLIFCVYNDNEEEGAMELLNLMDIVETAILKALKFGACFTLDPDEPLESLAYPDNSAPYYAGEMVGVFHLPSIEQEVDLFGKKN